MKKKYPIITLAVFLGILFDLLFWEKSPEGLNYPMFILAALAAALLAARFEKVRLPKWNWIIVGLVAYFAVMFILRSEPMTMFMNGALAFFLLMLLVSEFSNQKWLQYSFLNWIAQGFTIWFRLLLNPFKHLPAEKKAEEVADPKPANPTFRRIAVGILITIPILFVFSGLLRSADAVFNQQMTDLFDWFIPDNAGEFISRTLLVLFVSFFSIGALITLLKDSRGDHIPGKGINQSLIGFIESTILLGSVNLLFLLFTIIQFQYFFGGDAGREVAGLTYSEYARQGFSEMTIVAVFSLALIVFFSSIYREEEQTKHRWQLGLKTLLVVQVIIILVSAFQRLLLYEDAYGFTRLRTFSHIFIIWLGILLVVVLVLLFLRKYSRFAIASLTVMVGFAITINVINIDSLILKNNLNRMFVSENDQITDDEGNRRVTSGKLDTEFLADLSSDMLPALIDAAQKPNYQPLHSRINLVMACYIHLNLTDNSNPLDWQEFHPADHFNEQALLEYALNNPLGVEILDDDAYRYNMIFTKDDYVLNCGDYWYMD